MCCNSSSLFSGIRTRAGLAFGSTRSARLRYSPPSHLERSERSQRSRLSRRWWTLRPPSRPSRGFDSPLNLWMKPAVQSRSQSRRRRTSLSIVTFSRDRRRLNNNHKTRRCWSSTRTSWTSTVREKHWLY